jgi:hypothetical protein
MKTILILLLAAVTLAHANTQAELNELRERQRQGASGCKKPMKTLTQRNAVTNAKRKARQAYNGLHDQHLKGAIDHLTGHGSLRYEQIIAAAKIAREEAE